MIRRALLAALLLAVPQLAEAVTVTFTVQTQNVLRFGHGRRLATQCTAIDTLAPQVDFIVMQEVMAAGYPCEAAYNNKGVNGARPVNFSYRPSGYKGQSSYVEYYGILYRTAAAGGRTVTVAYLDQNDNLGTYANFARPPYGARFRVTDTATNQACNVWIVDFHAVFGKTIAGRRAEAEAMETVYNNLRGLNNGAVLIVGDWNLDAVDDAFDWVDSVANQASIDPNVQTSLTRAGLPSSEYDHAVSQKGPPMSVAQITTYPASPYVTWRNDVSDHLGVRLNVTVNC
ncbi:MAG TPA: hypothetical protein VFP12_04210 [Allosphingosinicella sp.]|nr:hypothetical protein [Allosphingosinicella sp.]